MIWDFPTQQARAFPQNAGGGTKHPVSNSSAGGDALSMREIGKDRPVPSDRKDAVTQITLTTVVKSAYLRFYTLPVSSTQSSSDHRKGFSTKSLKRKSVKAIDAF